MAALEEGKRVMRRLVLGALVAAPLLVLAPIAARAWGHGGHGGFHSHPHFFVGISPFGWGPGPWWWGPPPALGYGAYGYGWGWGYGYWTPPVVVVPEPPVDLEQGGAAATGFWYYCPSAREYYPRVGTCSEPWVRVPAPAR